MVGLVIVSHSRALAEGLVGLLRQVASPTLSVAIAAGIGENRSEFGTDAIEIMDAIQSVYSEDGVLVLMDLGSAVLSAKMALDLLPPEMTDKVYFCGAPLVEGAVAARSLNAIATLGAVENHQIRISASGEEAKLVLSALKVLIENNFGESSMESMLEEKPTEISKFVEESGSLKAVPISEGFALAPLFKHQASRPPIPTHPAENPEAEWTRLQAALEHTSREITLLARRMKQSIGSSEGAIFDAHLLILQDPDLIKQARAGIDEHHQNAAFAWNEAITAAAESYRALDDPYLQARAADVEDVGIQVLFAMGDKSARASLTFDEPVILYAADLTPTETSQLNMQMVLGIITAGGGPTSHSAILARVLGIPAVAGVGTMLERQPSGTLTGINGFTGEIWLEPAEDVQAKLRASRTDWLAGHGKLLQTSQQLAVTKDDHRVEVFANIGGTNDARAAVKNGAEGVGLLRTEFLFLTRETAPSEEEQCVLL